MKSILLAACLLLASACDGHTVTAPVSDVPGTWTLLSVNGQSLPAALRNAPDTVVAAETLILETGGLAIRSRVVNAPAAQSGTIATVLGSVRIYSIAAYVDFHSPDIDPLINRVLLNADVIGGRLRLEALGDTLLYARR